MADSQPKKKAKKSKIAVAESTAESKPDSGFPELKWSRQDPVRPNNRQRAMLGIAIGLLLAWWAALGWLVWDSL